MAIIKLNNATEITDLDLNNDYQTEALGYAVADDCVVVVKDSVPEPRLQEILNTWGQPSRELIHTYILIIFFILLQEIILGVFIILKKMICFIVQKY